MDYTYNCKPYWVGFKFQRILFEANIYPTSVSIPLYNTHEWKSTGLLSIPDS